MAVEVTWHDEQQAIIRTTFAGNWTMKQYRMAVHRCAEMLLEQRDRRVNFIVDIRDMILIPPDFVRQFRTVQSDGQSNTGLVVFVGADDSMQVLIDHVRNMLPRPPLIVFADSFEEAEARILAAGEEHMALSA